MHTQRTFWPSVAVLAAGLFLSSAIAVFAASPTVSYTASGSTPYSTLTVSGSGFQANEIVSLSLGLSNATATANGSGSFSGASLQIPNVPSGLYYVIAVGQTSGMVGFNSVWVNSFFAQASPSGWYLAPGSTLSWSGSGFVPNETVTVSRGGTMVATFTADASGNFSGAGGSVVPFSARNSTLTYNVRGASSGTNLSYTLAVADLYPYANPSSWYAAPGTSVTFSASGFGPNEGVSLYVGTSTVVLAHGTTDASGSIMGLGPVSLPFGTIANYRLVGDQSGAVATAPITLAGFYPSLSPSSYYSAPGATIALSGSGFAGNEPVTVTADGKTYSATTDNMGAFTIASVQVPATPNMPATISAKGQLSGAQTSFSMAIGQYYPSVTPSLWFSYPDDTLIFSGSGFAPNETVTVSGAGSGTITTDNTGSFTGYSGTLPSSNATFTFTGSKSMTAFPLTIALGQRVSAIWFDTYWANGGTALKVFGAGFGNNEQVALSYGSTALTTVSADASGNFTANTAIPYAPAGDVTIDAMGQTTHSSAHATLTVAPVWTDFHLESYAVPAGGSAHLIGSGYLPNETINLTTDRTGSTVVTSFTSNASGSFDTMWTIPADFAEGNLTITATSAHSFDSKPITFWVAHP